MEDKLRKQRSGAQVAKYRKLMSAKPGQIVHHKDGDWTNNDPSNLELMTQGEHQRLHRLGKRVKRPDKLLCPGCGEWFDNPRHGRVRKYCSLECYRGNR